VQQKLADATTVVVENVPGREVLSPASPFEDQFGGRAEGVLNETMAARGLRAFTYW